MHKDIKHLRAAITLYLTVKKIEILMDNQQLGKKIIYNLSYITTAWHIYQHPQTLKQYTTK